MKISLDIDDALYREAMALSTATGRTLEDMVSISLRRMLAQTRHNATDAGVAELHRWLEDSAAAMKDAPGGPSARELLACDRERLERL